MAFFEETKPGPIVPRTLLINLGLILLMITILSASFVNVVDGEQMVITRFGKPIGKPITKPGLRYKIALVDKAHLFPAGPLLHEDSGLEVSGQRVDLAVRWRIRDALVFYQRLQNEDRAQARLGGVLQGGLRKEVGDEGSSIRCRSAAGESGQDVCARLLETAQAQFADLGIEILDVELSTSP